MQVAVAAAQVLALSHVGAARPTNVTCGQYRAAHHGKPHGELLPIGRTVVIVWCAVRPCVARCGHPTVVRDPQAVCSVTCVLPEVVTHVPSKHTCSWPAVQQSICDCGLVWLKTRNKKQLKYRRKQYLYMYLDLTVHTFRLSIKYLST